MADIRTVRRFVKLEKQRRKIEDALKKIKADIEAVHGPSLEYFQSKGIQRQTIDGLTVHLRRELWASKLAAVTHSEACDALKEAGLGDFTGERINNQGLSAYVRELDSQDQELPATLEGIIKVSEVFKLGTRKA